MAFALSTIVSLAKMGWQVDLFLWEKPSLYYESLLPNNVNIKYFHDLRRRFTLVRLIWLPFQFQWRKNYHCVFGVGQIAAHIANIIAISNKCPFIYFNDEFPSFWGTNLWTNPWYILEQKTAKNIAMIVVPDPNRFLPLCRELDVSKKKYAFLPNIPIIKTSFEKINWHKKLGIPKDSIPFLYAGYLGDFMQIPEILSSLPYWNERAVLVIHNKSHDVMEKYRKELSHLDIAGKVFWSNKPLSETDLNSLVSYVAGNFALYRNTGPNMEYIGFSSGKLMRSLACGTPVIASQLPSLSFVKDYEVGVLVNHPCEIPTAIQAIIDNRDAYSKRCLDFVQTEVSFDKYWHKFCDQLKEEININLRKPV
jgi:glycosyltransferase involved in cell wall biosynthesis